ncbi:hypothetical protein SPRG_13689 [Saprolegnia parasitica CBS 223.65]|uniref:PB1 domain-containing protein n=1 Tax=Saprolegnia parasitica (strain CBS 223.65) TaxID=695850 RepID=A0A067C499_SAPPC|nr:hypothetical protein SPRG_13689 [Saprolegnia parasitica CBS 223.65]KDO21376.1 hypothetical protein SPRG_13689 [Saprolegnia parasitica CBS 223.65]|eukprot:XP_012207932.1 hypothetical protein SPRG_13689 [Saprolegnia parasitica CBS 223.65]
MNQQRMTAIKVGYKGEIHRVRVDLAAFAFGDLEALFRETFKLEAGSFVIQYKDNENDCLHVGSASEFEEACNVFLSSGDAVKSLRFMAVPTMEAAFHDNVADPILKIIESLVESLHQAMEKVKSEQWKQRSTELAAKAQETAQATGVVLNEKMQQTGIVINKAYHKTVEESKVAFEAAKKSLNEIEFEHLKKSLNEIDFDRLVKDTSDGVKSAADTIAAYANQLVEEIQQLKEKTATPVAAPVVAEAEVEIAEVAVEAPVVPEEQVEAEWEQVVEEAPVVVEATPEPSAEELKWAAQLVLIREVFPDVDAVRAIALLEAANGDVNVVLNSLFEM